MTDPTPPLTHNSKLKTQNSPGAVIFDMDGVLLDSEPLHWAALNAALGPAGPPVEEAEYRTYIGASAPETWQTILARRGLPGSVAEWVARYDDAVCAMIAAEAAPMPGLLPLLADLRAAGIPLALGTTSARLWATATLARLGLHDAFAAVVTGDQVARGKPAPDIFLRAAALLAVPPARCLVIEDSPRGIQAARAAGMFVVALQIPGALAAPPPADGVAADLVVPSLAAFHAWWRGGAYR